MLISEIGIPLQMWFVFSAAVVSMFAYFNDKYPMEFVSMGLMGVLLVAFTIYPVQNELGEVILTYKHFLYAFSNPALITVMSMLIIGHAVVVSGSLNALGSQLLKLSEKINPYIVVAITVSIACVVSAFMNNTPVVLIFIPILGHIAKSIGISPSKVMIPLAYAASLGGMMTLIGNSTNLLIAAKVYDMGYDQFGIFDFFLPGSILCVVGMLYVTVVLPTILPDRTSSDEDLLASNNSRLFIAEIVVNERSGLIGCLLDDVLTEVFPDSKLRLLQRGNRPCFPPIADDIILTDGDIIVILTAKHNITKIVQSKAGIMVHDMDYTDSGGKIAKNVFLTETVVAPNSSMVGQTLENIGLYSRFKTIVLGIQRRSKIINTTLSDIRLQTGDVLLILCTKQSLKSINMNQDLILLENQTEDLPNYSLIRKVNTIFAAVVLFAVFKVVPIMVSSFVGVVVLLWSRCLSMSQVTKALDRKVFLIIGAAYMLSVAMDKTGGVEAIVDTITYFFSDHSPLMVMTVLFVIIMLLNEIISNNAVGLVFAPIALKLADKFHTDPRFFLWGVIFASSCAFSTPIGYQTNLIIMSPGHYKFSDYMKSGIPLSLLMCGSYIIFAYYYFAM